MLLSKCDSCEQTVCADAVTCPRCGTPLEAAARSDESQASYWIAMGAVCCAVLFDIFVCRIQAFREGAVEKVPPVRMEIVASARQQVLEQGGNR